jgi:hypothetical protein
MDEEAKRGAVNSAQDQLGEAHSRLQSSAGECDGTMTFPDILSVIRNFERALEGNGAAEMPAEFLEPGDGAVPSLPEHVRAPARAVCEALRALHSLFGDAKNQS